MYALLKQRIQRDQNCHSQHPTTRGNKNQVPRDLDQQPPNLAVPL